MKCLSVLGSKLLDQVLQGSKLSPVDKVELLQEKQTTNIQYQIGWPEHNLTGVVVLCKKKKK